MARPQRARVAIPPTDLALVRYPELASADDTTIHFSPKERVASWDIKLIDENGKEHMRYKFNLLNISEITVTKQRDGSWYWSWK